jgi:hypothetical protein
MYGAISISQFDLKYFSDKVTVQCTNDSACSDQFGDMATCDFEYCDCKNGSHFDVEEGKCMEDITSLRSGQLTIS